MMLIIIIIITTSLMAPDILHPFQSQTIISKEFRIKYPQSCQHLQLYNILHEKSREYCTRMGLQLKSGGSCPENNKQ